MKDFYTEHYRALKKAIEEDIRRWKDIPCLWVGGLNVVKTVTFITQSYLQMKCNQNFYKTTAGDKTTPTFTSKHKRPQIEKQK